MDPAVQLLVDRAALHDLMMRYALGVDSRNFDSVGACFTADVDASSWGLQGRDALMQLISGVAFFRETMHMMGNQFIGIKGDEASMDTYAMLTHHLVGPDGETSELNLSGNRYIEKLTRQADGSWQIHQRGGDPEWASATEAGVTTDDPAVQWLLDRAEIHDLMMQYALGIDLHEYDRIRECFADEFFAAYGPLEYTDIDELIGLIKGVEGFESTTHFLGHQLIELDGDTARCDTPAMITHREIRDGEPVEWWPGGSRYQDVLTKVGGRWVISRRTHELAPLPDRTPAPPRSDDPDIQRLIDREAIHDVVAGSAAVMDQRDPSTFHFLGNQLIDIDGDHARAQTYAYITHRQADGMGSEWSKGAKRFVDELVRTDDGWTNENRTLTSNRIPDGEERLS